MIKKMIRGMRLIKKSPGLGLIAIIGVMYLLTELNLYYETSLPSLWVTFKLVAPVFLFWLICYGMVAAAQRKNAGLHFFKDFNVWKGLAILMVWPSITFWKQLFVDYHQVLDFSHPFNALLKCHLLIFTIFIVFIFPFSWFLAAGKKPAKTDIELFQFLKENAFQSFLWMKLFFQKVGSDRIGKSVACFTGTGYLLFFYMSFFSFILPAEMATVTVGYVVDVKTVDTVRFIRRRKLYESYCVLNISSGHRNLEFAAKSCPPCACEAGTKVAVTHHPFDYRNLRIGNVKCEENF